MVLPLNSKDLDDQGEEGSGKEVKIDMESLELDIDIADRLVKAYMEKHRRMAPAIIPEFPLREYPERMQDAEDVGGLLLQAEVHAQMAGLFAAFSFSALIADSSGISAHELSATDSIVAQVRVCLQLVAMLLLLTATSRCMWITVALTTQSLKHTWRAMGPTLSGACAIFHQGLLVFICDLPLYIYSLFGLKPAFFISIAFVLYWIKCFLGNWNDFLGMVDLLAAIDLGREKPNPPFPGELGFDEDLVKRRRRKKEAALQAARSAFANGVGAALPRPNMFTSQIAAIT
jgi:hypothetical protein